MIRLIGIDVDGTLVGSSGTVHPKVWAAAERARGAKIHLVLCSGRAAFGTALDYAGRLEPSGWHIFQNGASIMHLGTTDSRSVALPPALVTSFIARARASCDVLELYSDGRYVVESTTRWAREHADLLGVPFEPQPLDSLTEPVVRAQWLLSPSQAEQMLATANHDVDVSVSTSPLMPDTCFFGITNKGVNKGTGLRGVAAAYDIDIRDVMYVGDAGNDLPALQVAGCPIAMGNAPASVKDAATRVVDHVDAGGLAQAIDWAIQSRESCSG